MELFPAQPDLSLQISPPGAAEAGKVNGPRQHLTIHHQEMGFIRGIPLYHNNPPPSSIPLFSHQLMHQLHSPSSSFKSFHHHHHPLMMMRSSSTKFLSHRFPGKRSMRAPRMRWTTTLHASFVHAVQLLGGHESNLL